LNGNHSRLQFGKLLGHQVRPEPPLDGDNARDDLLVQFVVQLELL